MIVKKIDKCNDYCIFTKNNRKLVNISCANAT